MAALVRQIALHNGLKENQARIVFAVPGETMESEVAVLRQQLLTEDEKARQFLRAEDQHDYVVARSLLRLGLSSCFSVEPMEWVFTRDRRQKPFVLSPANLPPFQFSLSHTRGLIALLITSAPQAGLDVEYLERTNDLLLVAKRVCVAKELRSLSELEGDEWRNRFFQFWTLKEAYSKARGKGLSLSFEKVAFEIHSQKKITAQFAAELNDDPSAWQFSLRHPTTHHVMALAIKEARDLDIRKMRVGMIDGKPQLESA